MDLGLRGHVAVITGDSKGIGFGAAAALAREGCRVHIVSRDVAVLEAAKAKHDRDVGVSATTHSIDMSQRGACEELLSETGTPDILVNNAGAIPGGNLQTVDSDLWRSVPKLSRSEKAAISGPCTRGYSVLSG